VTHEPADLFLILDDQDIAVRFDGPFSARVGSNVEKRRPRRFSPRSPRHLSAAHSGNQTLACLIPDAARPCAD